MIIQSADQYNVPSFAAVIRQESVTICSLSYWRRRFNSNYSELLATNLCGVYDESTNIQCGAYILNHYYQSADSWFKATTYYIMWDQLDMSEASGHDTKQKYARSVKRHQKTLKVHYKLRSKKSPSINGLFYNFIRQINLQIKQKINNVPRYQEE